MMNYSGGAMSESIHWVVLFRSLLLLVGWYETFGLALLPPLPLFFGTTDWDL